MPELPEVETVRRGLAQHLVGRRITAVEVGRERAVRRTSREELIAGLTDTVVDRAERRGKYLLLPLDSGDTLMIHLRMSGQVLLATPGALRPPHTHVVLHLDDGQEVWFVDPRTFGEVVVFDPDRVAIEVPELARMGVDPIAEPFDVPALRAAFGFPVEPSSRCSSTSTSSPGSATSTPTRSCIGPGSDPIVRPTPSIDDVSVVLHDSIVTVLTDAIAAGGSTLGDAQYVDLMGEGGSYQDDHRVYGRDGQRCTTCGRGWIRRTVSGGAAPAIAPFASTSRLGPTEVQ